MQDEAASSGRAGPSLHSGARHGCGTHKTASAQARARAKSAAQVFVPAAWERQHCQAAASHVHQARVIRVQEPGRGISARTASLARRPPACPAAASAGPAGAAGTPPGARSPSSWATSGSAATHAPSLGLHQEKAINRGCAAHGAWRPSVVDPAIMRYISAREGLPCHQTSAGRPLQAAVHRLGRAEAKERCSPLHAAKLQADGLADRLHSAGASLRC